MDEAVPKWPDNMLKPQIELRVGGPREQALEVLARQLQGHMFRVRETRPDGFRARYWRWAWILVFETARRTEIEVTAVDTVIRVSTVKYPLEAAPQKRVAQALTAALAELRSRGIAVHWSPWTDEDPRMKRKEGRA